MSEQQNQHENLNEFKYTSKNPPCAGIFLSAIYFAVLFATIRIVAYLGDYPFDEFYQQITDIIVPFVSQYYILLLGSTFVMILLSARMQFLYVSVGILTIFVVNLFFTPKIEQDVYQALKNANINDIKPLSSNCKENYCAVGSIAYKDIMVGKEGLDSTKKYILAFMNVQKISVKKGDQFFETYNPQILYQYEEIKDLLGKQLYQQKLKADLDSKTSSSMKLPDEPQAESE